MISEIKANSLDEYKYLHLKTTLEFIYDNEETRALARSDLTRIMHSPDETVASFANRLSKAVKSFL